MLQFWMAMAGVESKAAPAPSEKTAEERFQQVGEQVFDLLKREDDLVHKQDVIKICNEAGFGDRYTETIKPVLDGVQKGGCDLEQFLSLVQQLAEHGMSLDEIKMRARVRRAREK
eukprot:TRINITY_DN8203_c0_g1_i1.p2 TRINITY_DN8203_c0_g1~~TRINITY_DN8203_c0_g1_i1.p2  ORF type:complete len:115 (+),score=40.25 TRINITY_DN8203_c0_g1_i1:678-1022(+)